MLYIRTTTDELELPVAVADSVTELAKLLKTTPGTVSSSISHKHKGWYRIREEDVNENWTN